jgi:hypothetical protein
MKALLIVLLLSGCATTYEVKFGDNTFKARSYREFKNIKVKYKDFDLEASGVTDDTAEVVIGVTDDTMENLAWFLKAQADPTAVLEQK